MRIKTITYLIISVSLILGLIIYIGFRDNLIINRLIHMEVIKDYCSLIKLPNWFIYSLPDALWMFALILLIVTIWNFTLSKPCIIWIIISFLTGILFEILQKPKFIIGTFDYIDLIFIIVASIFPILLTFKLKGVKK